MDLFKPNEMQNEVSKLRLQEAHEEVVKEILDELADENGKVKMFKGGRFELIESAKDEKLRKKQEVSHNKMLKQFKKDEEKMKMIEDAQLLFDTEAISLEPKWIDHGAKAKDLTTLVFNILQYKLNVGLSLESSIIMSLSGAYIYVVVKAKTNDLKKIAEESNFTMQLAIGLTDLTSLEPCDRYGRPLRKCVCKRQEIVALEKVLEPYFAIVDGNIQELLRDEKPSFTKEEEVIGDISEKEWDTYHEYLKLIQEGFEDFKKYTVNRPHIKGVHLKTLGAFRSLC